MSPTSQADALEVEADILAVAVHGQDVDAESRRRLTSARRRPARSERGPTMPSMIRVLCVAMGSIA